MKEAQKTEYLENKITKIIKINNQIIQILNHQTPLTDQVVREISLRWGFIIECHGFKNFNQSKKDNFEENIDQWLEMANQRLILLKRTIN
jgi:hypothetical protein